MTDLPAGAKIDERCQADLRRLERAQNDSALIARDGPMERRIEFVPGHNHTQFNCGHGINGMTLRFVLMGPAGAVQWVTNLPNWVPGNVRRTGIVEAQGPTSLVPVVHRPLGDGHAWDLGYHALTEQFEGQGRMECHLLPGGFCYYDGSGLNAQPVLAAFLEHGPMAVWATLARYYIEIFGNTEQKER